MSVSRQVTVVSLDWRGSTHQRRLVTLIVLALFAATASRQAIVAVLAAPPMWLLVLPHLRNRGTSRNEPALDAELTIESTVTPARVLEGETVELRVRISSRRRLDQLDLALIPFSTSEIVLGEPHPTHLTADQHVDVIWQVRAGRWGRRELGHLEIHAHGVGRLVTATTRVALNEVSVFPHHPPLSVIRTPAWLPDRIGDHVSRVAGEGVEFVDVRDYRVGDRPRRINWRASARRGSLQANRTAAERACDVVLLLDAYSDVGDPRHSSLDVAVRGVVATAQAYLARHDRVGLVVLGGELTWLRPDVGGRQFYRVIEQVLDARRAHAADRRGLELVPNAALPPGALGLLFSPLLDPRAFTTLRALRERGVRPVVVDVRTCEPASEPSIPNADLALRLWRIEHLANVHGVVENGIPVVAWDGTDSLDAAFSQLPKRMRSA